jgi:hypothetical protein
MNQDILLFLVTVIAALMAGALFGAIVVSLFRRGAAAPLATSQTPASSANELLRIDSDPRTNRLLLRVHGQPLLGVEAISDASLREQVRGLLVVLGAELPVVTDPWRRPPATAGAVAPAAAPVARPEIGLPRVDATVQPLVDPPPPDDDLNAPFLDRLLGSIVPRKSGSPARPARAAARKAGRPPPAEPPPSMFEQIDAILQRKLRAQTGAPNMRIYEEAGELRIRVGEEVLRQVDGVTDERARALLREAVSEWEAAHL